MEFIKNMNPALFTLLTLILVGLKGYTLWKASKNNHKIFFAVILFFNTLGIVEIVYLILDKYKFNVPVLKKLKNGSLPNSKK